MDNQIDIAQLSTSDLKRLQDVAAETIESRRAGEQASALEQIKSLAEAHELTTDMIVAFMTPKAKRGRKPGSGATKAPGSKAPPKYLDPVSGATWTGKGRKPEWIKAAADPELMLIATTAPTPAKTPKPSANLELTSAPDDAAMMDTAAE